MKHWTQTRAGKKKMAERMGKMWARKKAEGTARTEDGQAKQEVNQILELERFLDSKWERFSFEQKMKAMIGIKAE